MIDQTALEAGQVIATAVGVGALEGASDAIRSRVRNLLGLLDQHLAHEGDVLADLNVQSRRPNEDNAAAVARQLADTDAVKDAEILEEAREIVEQARQQGIFAEGEGSVAAGSITQMATGGGNNYTGGTHTNTVNHIQGHSNQAVPDWAVQWSSGDTYSLTKNTTGTAYDVEVSLPEKSITRVDELQDPTWQAAESRSFIHKASWSGDRNMVIKYRNEPEGEWLEKKVAIPPRPKR